MLCFFATIVARKEERRVSHDNQPLPHPEVSALQTL
jgi:hypothetical protein